MTDESEHYHLAPENLPAPLSILDKTDERSVYNISPPEAKRAIERVALKNDGGFFTLAERVQRYKAAANERDDAIRVSFWAEYERAQAEGRLMHETNVIRGICTKQYFQAVMRDPRWEKAAYILSPPTDYIAGLKAVYSRTFQKMQEILDLPLVDDRGRVDYKLAGIVKDLLKYADMRLNGSITQKVQIQQQSLNYNITQDLGPEMKPELLADDIEAKAEEAYRKYKGPLE